MILAASLLLAIAFDLTFAFIQSKTHPVKYEEEIEKYSAEYNIPIYIVYAVIDVESNFEHEATSGKAYGLMQMTPSTFAWLTSNEHLGENLSVSELFDPDVNIRYGCYYLNYLREKFNNWDTVFAAYNGGEGNVSKWLSDARYSTDGKTLNKIPFKETRDYVKKVNKSKQYYRGKILF